MDSSTVLSWTAFTCVSGALVCYYTGGTKYIGKLFSSPQVPLNTQQQIAGNKRRQNQPTGRRKDLAVRTVAPVANAVSSTADAIISSAKQISDNSNTKKRKVGRALSKAVSEVHATSTHPKTEDPDDEDNDVDWAKQLAAAQTGVSLEKSSGKAALKKKAKEQEDLSKSAPQAVQTTSAPPPPQPEKARPAGDVSDMLEEPASGPSVIKITGEYLEKPKKASKAPEVKASQKQRQNRRKVEERAAQREADERARRQLEENQRRSAREARGEPAKNGLAAANAPSSVWEAASNGASGQSAPEARSLNSNTQLLDTFDHDAASVSSNEGANTTVTTPATNASVLEDIPSEEAQLQILAEMSGWNEVNGKKKKTKGKAMPNSPPSEAGSRTSTTAGNISTSKLTNGTSRAPTPVVRQAPIKKATTSAAPSINGYAALGLLKESTIPKEHQGHPDDSEWAP